MACECLVQFSHTNNFKVKGYKNSLVFRLARGNTIEEQSVEVKLSVKVRLTVDEEFFYDNKLAGSLPPPLIKSKRKKEKMIVLSLKSEDVRPGGCAISPGCSKAKS